MKYVVQTFYAYFILALGFTAIGVVGYWLFIQPADILSNLQNTVIVNNSTTNIVEAGKIMVLSRTFCINSNKYIGTVSRTFTNHVVYQLPDTSTQTLTRNLGCSDKQYVIEVPSVLPSGKYEYNVYVYYKINPLRTVGYKLAPVTVTVVNPVWDKIIELIKEEDKK